VLLSQYIVQVRRLLNEARPNYWSDQELADYVNEARQKTAIDTICCRKFQTSGTGTLNPAGTGLVQGQETYEYTDPGLALPQGNLIVDIINITIIWGAAGNSRIQLGWMPFTKFSAYFRPWVNYQRTPAAFTIYNATSFWVGFIPDITYPVEFDTAIVPLPLVSDNDTDLIPKMYDQAVKYWAARLARLKLQQYNEADKQESYYMKEIARIGAMPPRRIPYQFENELF
jgi:hypothetical protein